MGQYVKNFGNCAVILSGVAYWQRLFEGACFTPSGWPVFGYCVTRHEFPPQLGGLKRIVHLLSFALSSISAMIWSWRRRTDMIIVVASAFFALLRLGA
jgi:hypothetical protein